jgi:transcriptional regulator with XRE-family HTH domain
MATEHLTPHDWKEWRRMQALHLMKQEGWKQRDIAVALDVREGAVSRWLAAARREGAEALLSQPAPGLTPNLTPQGKMYSLVCQEALNGLHSVAFLGHLLRLTGERLLVIWDGSPIHRRAEVYALQRLKSIWF